MDFPEELKYTKEHIWVRVENNSAVIGITDFAQEDLGTVRGVELPEEGELQFMRLSAGPSGA